MSVTGGRPPEDVNTLVSLKVDNLDDRVEPDSLRDVFKKFGEVADVYIPIHPRNNRPRGYGFVRFRDKKAADEAIAGTDGMELEGRKITVGEAKYGRDEGRKRMREDEERRGPPRDRDRYEYDRRDPRDDRYDRYDRGGYDRGYDRGGGGYYDRGGGYDRGGYGRDRDYHDRDRDYRDRDRYGGRDDYRDSRRDDRRGGGGGGGGGDDSYKRPRHDDRDERPSDRRPGEQDDEKDKHINGVDRDAANAGHENGHRDDDRDRRD
ncbi:unnamed protein product [Vitrella brassicaformis CCMP3155]|uniref:RRM domain-containing protein n=2 Tax=Vitrella brassicaformis TaxID=1169539 RepID=A0A0G4GB41_VITBC|nr:unnamed protein product [Vitrella brassicaformis CCMP3155]|eukprot:CEM26349.1 unnamed protein product [Vitrella brassicaformis CCMP3155]